MSDTFQTGHVFSGSERMEKTLTCTGHQYTGELGPCVPVVNTGEGQMYNV